MEIFNFLKKNSEKINGDKPIFIVFVNCVLCIEENFLETFFEKVEI